MITVIDGASGTVLAGEPVGRSWAALGANPTTNHIFVGKGYDVAVMSGANNTILSTLTLGRPSAAFAVNPVTNRIYAANADGDSVTVIQDEGAATKNLYLPLVLRPTS
jgi:DNA-binding beta-propeller fold protein YncE